MKIEEIKKVITDDFLARPEVRRMYGITDQEIVDGATFETLFSPLSIESLLFGSVAEAGREIADMFEQHKLEVAYAIADQRSGSLGWWEEKARQFRYGMELVPGTDRYEKPDSAYTEEALKNMKPVTYASARENKTPGYVTLKIASGEKGALHPLDAAQEAAFREYMRQVGYAGIATELINQEGDRMTLHVNALYDPLILDFMGRRLDGTDDRPLYGAMKMYLQELPFNGMFTFDGAHAAMKAVPGIRAVQITHAEARSYSATGTLLPPHAIGVSDVPLAGYYTMQVAEMTVNYHIQ